MYSLAACDDTAVRVADSVAKMFHHADDMSEREIVSEVLALAMGHSLIRYDGRPVQLSASVTDAPEHAQQRTRCLINLQWQRDVSFPIVAIRAVVGQAATRGDAVLPSFPSLLRQATPSSQVQVPQSSLSISIYGSVT